MALLKTQQTATELLKAETGDIRTLQKHETWIVGIVAVSWAIFQLALAGFLVLDSTKTRAIHLAFGMALLYLLNPCLRHPRQYLGYLSVTGRIPFIDYLFAIAGVIRDKK